MRALLHRLHRCRRGAVAVEMAMVTPVLAIAVLGVADFGLAVNERMQLSSAARVGAQVAMTNPADTGRITQAVQQATDGLDPARLTVSVSTSSDGGERHYVTVRVEETYPLLFGFLGVGSSVRLGAEATMRTQGETS
jgi:Flp pilus assembly protein TadG